MNAPSPSLAPMTPDQWDLKYPLIASNVFRNVATLAAVMVGFIGLGFQGYLSNRSNAQQAIQLEAQTYLTSYRSVSIDSTNALAAITWEISAEDPLNICVCSPRDPYPFTGLSRS